MGEQSVNASPEILARRLEEAFETRVPIPPLSESEGLDSVEQAYAIQSSWGELRRHKGERTVGRKIGLTSQAMREQLGVSEPDYGSLWASRHFPTENGMAEMPSEVFLHPLLEAEIAFLIGKPLYGADVTAQQVLAATDALAPAVEVVDSRIEDWRIELADTIADNASYAGFAVGTWSRDLKEVDLRTLGLLMHLGESEVAAGVGAASLGHPAKAVAWLANKLASFGESLQPGDIVLSGALDKAIPATQGDTFVIEMHGQPPLTVAFA